MQVAGTTDKQLQMWMKEMDETSNEIAAPIVDLIFRTFPVLLNLPFSFTKKPSYCKCTIDEVMNSIRKISVSSNDTIANNKRNVSIYFISTIQIYINIGNWVKRWGRQFD